MGSSSRDFRHHPPLSDIQEEQEDVGPDRQVLPRRSTRHQHTTPPHASIANPVVSGSDPGTHPAESVRPGNESRHSIREDSSDDDFSSSEEGSSSADKETDESRTSSDEEEVSPGRGEKEYVFQNSTISPTNHPAKTDTIPAVVTAPFEPTTLPPDPSRTKQVPQAPVKTTIASATPPPTATATATGTAHQAPIRRKYGNQELIAELNRYKPKRRLGKLSAVQKTRFAALKILCSKLAGPSHSKAEAIRIGMPSMEHMLLEDDSSVVEDVVVPSGPWPYYRIGPKPSSSKAVSGQDGRDESSEKRKRNIIEPIEPSLEPPPKRKKMWTPRKVHVPVDLAILRPQPIRLTFPHHPLEDRSDEWYIAQFEALFDKLEEFVKDFFAAHDLDQGQFHQLWAVDMTPEFLNYVEQVAEPDINQGGWDEIIHNTKQRKFLVKAVVMRILEIKVFGAELLGATQQEDDMMMSLERGLFTREGFVRQQLRAQQVRTILGFGSITRNFHSEIAKLTAQITLLLQPLSEYLYALPPNANKDDPSNTNPNPTIQEQYQVLHDIVSMAGYLSIAIRLSPTIFFFNSASPGDHWQDDDHISVDEEAYSASKAFLEEPYKAAFDIWKADYDVLQTQLKAAEPELRFMEQPKTEAGQALAVRMKAMRDDPTRPMPPGSTHRALVKIGILPNIRRFKPGGQMDDDANEPLHSRTGFRIREMHKAHVLCYFGDERIPERAKQWVSLSLHDFVKYNKARHRGIGVMSSWSKWMAAGATGAVLGAAGLKCLGVEPDFLTDAWPFMNLRDTLLGAA